MRNPSASARLALVPAAEALAVTARGGVQNTTIGGSDSGEYPTGAVEMPVGASAGGFYDLDSRQVMSLLGTATVADLHPGLVALARRDR